MLLYIAKETSIIYRSSGSRFAPKGNESPHSVYNTKNLIRLFFYTTKKLTNQNVANINTRQ